MENEGTRAALGWDLLRCFEATARAGSLSAAARDLGVSQSTVSRQLARLEEQAGEPLLLRETPVRPTPRGAALLAAVQPMVDGALAAAAALEDTLELRGEVSVTSVGELVRWVLTPALPQFYERHPHLRLRLLADNRVRSLAAGEADLALRFRRPRRGALVARKLMTERYGLFVAAGFEEGRGELPWLGLAGSLAEIPEQRWAERAFSGRPARLLVEDVESLGLAVEAGLGVAVLPRGLARVLEVEPIGLEAAGVRARAPIDARGRDLWLVVHRSKRELPRVRAVMDWLFELLGRDEPVGQSMV